MPLEERIELFKVCVTIHEARHLAWTNMDPQICVTVGNYKKYTASRDNTDRPYYNEVEQASYVFRRRKYLGSVSLDVATVWMQPGHQFHRKWAPITDRNDVTGAIRGYIKCDIFITSKEEPVQIHAEDSSEDDEEEDIEKNLMVPESIIFGRQKAFYIFSIYRADGLPKAGSVLGTNMKRAMRSTCSDLPDTYIEISFAGMTGKTDTKKRSRSPEWDQQLIFSDMFPPLSQRIKIVLRDKYDVIATHFIEFKAISYEADKGYLPTFGPTFIHLYGTSKDHNAFKLPITEAPYYHGRVLLGIDTQLHEDSPEVVANPRKRTVLLHSIPSMDEASHFKYAEVLLFGVLFDVSMLHPVLNERNLHVEISLGNAGNMSSGLTLHTNKERFNDDLTVIPAFRSCSSPFKPKRKRAFFSKHKCFLTLPVGPDKPCMFVRSVWPDFTYRLRNANLLAHIANFWKDKMCDVRILLEQLSDAAVPSLQEALSDLSQMCLVYLDKMEQHQLQVESSEDNYHTPLDRKHIQRCLNEVNQIMHEAELLIKNVTMDTARYIYRQGMKFYRKLEFLLDDSQQALPDVFVWLLNGNKRIGFRRLRGRQLFFSLNEEERGEYCGRVCSLILKAPSRNWLTLAAGHMTGKINIFLWLGLSRHGAACFEMLPPGFSDIQSSSDHKSHHKGNDGSLLNSGDHKNIPKNVDSNSILLNSADLNSLNNSNDQTNHQNDVDNRSSLNASNRRSILSAGDQRNRCNVRSLPGSVERKSPHGSSVRINLPGNVVHKTPGNVDHKGPHSVVEQKSLLSSGDHGSVRKSGDHITALKRAQRRSSARSQSCHIIIPTHIHYTTYMIFQARAYIYQARVIPGSDSTGLCDPYIRVSLDEHCQTTEALYKTLNPKWDQMLIFEKYIMYGSSPSYVQNNPPTMILEIMDKDRCNRTEQIGISLTQPIVQLAGQQYKKPALEWLTLYRGRLTGADVLASFELIEVTGDALESLPEELEDKGPIYTIPEHIRPTMVSYRLEVLFWGIRDLKRIFCFRKHKPKVVVDLGGTALHSSTLKGSKNANFSSSHKFIELELPLELEYQPAAVLKVLDARSFGRNAFIGCNMIRNLPHYMFSLPTVQERAEYQENISISYYTDPKLRMDSRDMSLFTRDIRDQLMTPRKRRWGNLHSLFSPESQKKNIKNLLNARNTRLSLFRVPDKAAEDDALRDWWSKYYAALKDHEKGTYPIELPASEDQPNTTEPIKKQPRRGTSIFGLLQMKNAEQHDYGNKAPPSAENISLSEGIGKHSTPMKRQAFREAADLELAALKNQPSKSAKNQPQKPAVPKVTLKIYNSELESQPEFHDFADWLHTFNIYRGKWISLDEEIESNIVGKIKGALMLYQWPPPPGVELCTPTGQSPEEGVMKDYPRNEPVSVVVRVYVVKGIGLHPKDVTGKSDPYLVVKLGHQKIGDRKNYIPREVNPIFGKCFEFEVTFPYEYLLTVRVMDWDFTRTDDLIGETKIDLENRFYSWHRGSCGIASKYDEKGYNKWRDAQKPTEILKELCKRFRVDGPRFGTNSVSVGPYSYEAERTALCTQEDCPELIREELALQALKQWDQVPLVGCKLVPEHVETRSLYNPSMPGIEQGRLHMWVDILQKGDEPLPPPVNISPRQPEAFELRCIIWNTADVVLIDDDYFLGEKVSDIYVRGWLTGMEDVQYTDVHYRSLTGEGNFNWRFIYPFLYQAAEEKMIIHRKEGMFVLDQTEFKLPCRLTLQVWDSDHFSPDDFLGMLALNLSRMPRGAKSRSACNLSVLSPEAPTINLFNVKVTKGWWPFQDVVDNTPVLVGKLEMELQLLTQEEATFSPVGKGRTPPEPLEKPKRPDTSFSIFTNPLKACYYGLYLKHRRKCCRGIFVVLVLVFFALGLYSAPGYLVKKLLGA